jgi:uncharacterized repeat protein (TIGR01451 family)
MKNTINVLFTALVLLLGNTLSAQQFFFSAERPSACASTNGILTIVPMRGVPPFTYSWSNGATDLSLKNIPKGVYSATMTDATGATVSHTYHLNSEELYIYLISSKPVTFCTPLSGELELGVNGGVAPYTYTWSNGQTTSTASALTANTYSVTVVDATGCSATGEYLVETANWSYSPYATIQIDNHPDCSNTNAGILSAYMEFSGYGPYTYQWTTGATTPTVNGMPKGLYGVTVTDDLGCSRSTSIFVDHDLSLSTNVVCTGANTGYVTAQLTNGVAPVIYQWSTGQTGSTISNLNNGTYVVTATDANGCSSVQAGTVAVPVIDALSANLKCYSGNGGGAYVNVFNDGVQSYLWDNGETSGNANSLSPGQHSVTVTTSLGCILTDIVTIDPPVAAPFQITAAPTPANCATGVGGSLNLNITGGTPAYNFYAYGPNGFSSNAQSALQNLQAGSYWITVNNWQLGCYGYATVTVPDNSGFNPELVTQELDCINQFGAAAVTNVTNADATYQWSTGNTGSSVFNLTQGCYSVVVTAGNGNCTKFFEFCLYPNDSFPTINNCFAEVSGQLINDNNVPGCTGTTGIPYQLIRTEPSGALTFTNDFGQYQVFLPQGTFDIEPASYDANDIVCPAGGFYTVTATPGTPQTGLDFHFYNPNPIDYRVRQRPLRTAQPGYPFSMRIDVCNDGTAAPAGSLDYTYGNFLTNVLNGQFSKNNGTFTLTGITSGAPENTANFTFPSVSPGTCEVLQIDFQVPTTVPGATEFLTQADVSPVAGDPTPDNNTSRMVNTVMGSFDPNAVYAFPARKGNPKDGGEILQNVDNSITYQIVFQNTGTAPADIVVIKDTLSAFLDINTIRNISTSHEMKVHLEDDNKVLVFQFPNIHLPDSTSDFAGSIGSVQFDINLKPGLPLGTVVEKQAAIFFDFNAPVITNNNQLTLVDDSSDTRSPIEDGKSVVVFPNPASDYFAFYLDEASVVRVFNSLGAQVWQQKNERGLQRVMTQELPVGIYMVRFEIGDKLMHARVVVQR